MIPDTLRTMRGGWIGCWRCHTKVQIPVYTEVSAFLSWMLSVGMNHTSCVMAKPNVEVMSDEEISGGDTFAMSGGGLPDMRIRSQEPG